MVRWLFLFSALLHVSQSSPNTYYSSSCDQNTQWNRINVDKALKTWITSFESKKFSGHPDENTSMKLEVRRHQDANKTLEFVASLNEKSMPMGNAWGTYMKPTIPSPQSAFVNGFFYGPVDEKFRVHGQTCAFIFPDMRTAFYGVFKNGRMESAQATRITAERCKNGVKELKFAKIEPNSPKVGYHKASQFRYGGNPALIDPYEKRAVYVSDSDYDEGLFAKRDLQPGELVSYYYGLEFPQNTLSDLLSPHNKTEDEFWSIYSNVIQLGDASSHIYCSHQLDVYRATLGHKANHSFKKTNAFYQVCYHPRYGKTNAVFALRPIKKHQEILTNYGYNLNGNGLVPLWYAEAYNKEENSAL